MSLKIEFSFDDGSSEDWKLYDLFVNKNYEVTFYIPVEWEAHNLTHKRMPLSRYTFDKIKERFEIGSHSVNHPLLTRIPKEQAEYEIVESKNLLKKFYNLEVTKFCPPRGYSNPDLYQIIAQHYDYCRSTLVGNLTIDDPLWHKTTVHIGAKRKEYEELSWLDFAYKKLDEAIERSKNEDIVYHAWGHSWEIEKNNEWDNLKDLLKKMEDK